MKAKEERLFNLFGRVDSIYIYGAGRYGMTFLRVLERYGLADRVKGFIVTKRKPQELLCRRYKVFEIKEITDKDTNICVAVDKKYQIEIMDLLSSFENVFNVFELCDLINAQTSYNTVKTVSIKELWDAFYVDHVFEGYEIVVEYLLIKCIQDNCELYELERIYMEIKALSEKQFASVKESMVNLYKYWEENGKEDFELVVDDNMRIVGDSLSLSVAILFGYSYAKIREKESIGGIRYDMEWLKKTCDSGYVKERIIKEKELMENAINSLDYLSKRVIVQKAETMLGQIEQFGTKGCFYQSLPMLDIQGQRPTNVRIDEYGLESVIKDKSVLDIGCNVGFFDLEIARLAGSVDGIEYNSRLVEIGNEIKRDMGIDNVCISQGDFNVFKTDKRYDVILSFAVHEWIGMRPETYSSRLVSLLKERKGKIVFESQALPEDQNAFDEHCMCFERLGGELVKSAFLKDDGQTLRKYVIYSYK